VKYAEETFIEGTAGSITFRMATGSIDFNHPNGIVYRNDRGEITNIEKRKHYVCCGTDYCFECGRKMTA